MCFCHHIFIPETGDAIVTCVFNFSLISSYIKNIIQSKIMTCSVDDAWTNHFQPFWAIPLLGVTGIKARHMFGSCITMLFALSPFPATVAAFLGCTFGEALCLV